MNKNVLMPGVGKVLGSLKGPSVPGGKSSSVGPPLKKPAATVLTGIKNAHHITKEQMNQGEIRVINPKPTLQQQRAARGFVHGKKEEQKVPVPSQQQKGPNIMTLAEVSRNNMSDINKPMD